MVFITIVKKNQEVYNMEIESLDLNEIHPRLNNNNSNLKKLTEYIFHDEKIELYGYDNGLERNINRLELPENDIYYDDLVFVSKNLNNELNDLKDNDFEDLYDSLFNGIDNLSDYEDEFEQDEGYITDDNFVELDV